MKIFGSLKRILPIILLSACSALPEFPEVWQCQFNGTPRAFYCINVRTKAKLKIPADAPSMKAAQCVSPDDFKKVQDWVQSVKEIAESRCK